MLLSISESDELLIRKHHLISALSAIKHVEEKIPTAIAHVGATEHSNTADMIVSIITSITPEPMSRSVLLRRVYRRLSGGAPEFQTIIDDLKESHRIYEEADKKGIFYSIEKPGIYMRKWKV